MVGVHLVGDRVGELVGEAQLIYGWEAHAEDVAPLVHAHPTQNEALGEAHLALAGKPLHAHSLIHQTDADRSTPRRSPMATEVTLPALGESVTEGTVTRWLKQVGDSVSVDEALLEVSTDKVDTEIPSPVAGTLLEIKAAEDETVEVGAVLARDRRRGRVERRRRRRARGPGERPGGRAVVRGRGRRRRAGRGAGRGRRAGAAARAAPRSPASRSSRPRRSRPPVAATRPAVARPRR